MRGPGAGVRGSAVDESGSGRLEGQGGAGAKLGIRKLENSKSRSGGWPQNAKLRTLDDQCPRFIAEARSGKRPGVRCYRAARSPRSVHGGFRGPSLMAAGRVVGRVARTKGAKTSGKVHSNHMKL